MTPRSNRANLLARIETQQAAQFAVLSIQPQCERLPLAQARVLLLEPGIFLGQCRHPAEIAADIASGTHRQGHRLQNGSQQVSHTALYPVEDVDFRLADDQRDQGHGNKQGEHGPAQGRLDWRFGFDLRPCAVLLQDGGSPS